MFVKFMEKLFEINEGVKLIAMIPPEISRSTMRHIQVNDLRGDSNKIKTLLKSNLC